MTITENNIIDNGVNVEALLGAREMLSGAPEAAQFTFAASNRWVNGTHSRSTVNGFVGLGDDQAHRVPYSVDTDHPEIFASEDNGPTPPEMVLMGLAGCLTAGVASVAQNRGIQLHSVTSTVEGDLDVAGILGIDPEVRNGFGGIRVRFEIDADATRDEIEAVVAQSQKRSAVFDIVANPTAVVVDVA
ncbi:OsmC family protein [Ilumatobacter sp.]|uniref:OsmC family protein n=1 Tax=Ilumatobacter sp. TaxID=1967498 RepID=UPI003C30F446